MNPELMQLLTPLLQSMLQEQPQQPGLPPQVQAAPGGPPPIQAPPAAPEQPGLAPTGAQMAGAAGTAATGAIPMALMQLIMPQLLQSIFGQQQPQQQAQILPTPQRGR